MKLLSLLALSGLAAAQSKRSMQHVGKKVELPKPRHVVPVQREQHVKRQNAPMITTEASKSEVRCTIHSNHC